MISGNDSLASEMLRFHDPSNAGFVVMRLSSLRIALCALVGAFCVDAVAAKDFHQTATEPNTQPPTNQSSSNPSPQYLMNEFERLDVNARFKVFACKMEGGTYLNRLSMGEVGDLEKLRTCADEGTAMVKDRYRVLKKEFANDKDAMSALNDYIAILLTAFESLMPQAGESDGQYDKRIDQTMLEISKEANMVKLQFM